MGTRADFYIGRGPGAEWLGSVAWDAYPSGLPSELLAATSEDEFRARVAELASRDDWTSPSDGWPWPWNDSHTTDYAYAFDGGAVWAASFGHGWFPATGDEPDEDSEADLPPCVFPDMTAIQSVTLGKRSGVMIFG
jgi:hypothetical protein